MRQQILDLLAANPQPLMLWDIVRDTRIQFVEAHAVLTVLRTEGLVTYGLGGYQLRRS